jgi:hypothetical protein
MPPKRRYATKRRYVKRSGYGPLGVVGPVARYGYRSARSAAGGAARSTSSIIGAAAKAAAAATGAYYANRFLTGDPRGTVTHMGNAAGWMRNNAAEAAKWLGNNLIYGHGDYKNSKRGTLNMGGAVPQFGNSNAVGQAGGIRVQHREYIQDIQGTTAWAVQNFPLNPGLNDTFPWLDAVAANFEQYRICGMCFVYKATCATAVASTNTALGTVIMATQYNALAAPFTNKQQMENYQFAQSGVPFNDIVHCLECAPRQSSVSNLYVRTGSVPSGQDARLYDFGVFSLATVGMQAPSTIGELWVTYDIELLKPRIVTGTGGNMVLSDHFNSNGSTVTSSAFMGTGPLAATPTSNLGGVLQANDGKETGNLNYYIFPQTVGQGTFLLMYQASGTSGTLSLQLTTAFGTNLNPFLGFGNGASLMSFVEQPAGSSSGVQFVCQMLSFNGGTAVAESYWGITAGTLPSPTTSMDLWVTQINPVQITMLGEIDGKEKMDKLQRMFDAWVQEKAALAEEEEDDDLQEVRERVNYVDDRLAIDRGCRSPDRLSQLNTRSPPADVVVVEPPSREEKKPPGSSRSSRSAK